MTQIKHSPALLLLLTSAAQIWAPLPALADGAVNRNYCPYVDQDGKLIKLSGALPSKAEDVERLMAGK